MNPSTFKRLIEDSVVNKLKTIYDPEIPVNIYDLGLIYEIRVGDNNKVFVRMTLTAPNCPVAESLPVDVKESIATINGVNGCDVEVVFDPPWDKEMMSEEAKLELGFL
jgi:FeS assembly SUF system protein